LNADEAMKTEWTQSTELKLTTILSADAVGYSRLMGQDESGTFATRKA